VSFYGEFTQKIDGKGRVSIPVDFRRALEQGDPDWAPGGRPRVRIVYGDPRRRFL
jgi:MraZ protein